MKEIINFINDWDTVGLFPLAPKDEYFNEIMKIEKYLYDNASINVETLAKRINEMECSENGIA